MNHQIRHYEGLLLLLRNELRANPKEARQPRSKLPSPTVISELLHLVLKYVEPIEHTTESQLMGTMDGQK